MSEFTTSLRLAARSLLKQRRFTILATTTLALGIGVTTAFFSVFDTILLRPLAYAESERLVTVLEPGRSPTSPANFETLEAQAATLESWTAAAPWHPVLRGDGPAEQIPGLQASGALFDLLGVEPLLGRSFAAGDEERRVLVLGHELWQRRLGGDQGVIGRTWELDGEPYTVVGVMPPGFSFPPFWATDAEFWAPFPSDGMWRHRNARFLRVFARLTEGSDVATAQSEVDVVARRLAAEFPDENTELRYLVEPMSEPVVEGIRPALRTILFGVGLVLLIACANVASLLLTRTAGRRQELAVRRALGARAAALWRQGLAESLCLVALAVGLGWQLALWGLEAVKAFSPPDVPRLAEASLDARVFAFTALVGALVTVAFACLLPLYGRRSGVELRAGHRRLPGAGESRSRSALVTAEVAMALVLLLASGLLARSLFHLWHLDAGLRSEGVLTVQLPFGGTEVAEPEAQNAFFDRLIHRVEGLAGVESAALINHLHLGGDLWGFPYEVEGRPVEHASEAPRASHRVVSEGLFEAFDIPLREGRFFTTGDRSETRPVVIVSQNLAAEEWPGESAVGKRIRGFSGERPWLEVVGVVGNVRQWSLTEEPTPEIYFPYRQNPVAFWTQTSLVVTTGGEAQALLDPVARSLRSMTPELPLSQPRTLRQIYGQLLWEPRFSVSLLSIFAFAAVMLASVGVYGAMSFAAAARRRELGVRAALGAERRDLVRLLVGRGLVSTGYGLALGLLAAIGLGRWLEGQLFGVSAHDPWTAAAAAIALATLAAFAAYLPALRASRVDPNESLRQEV